jgi:hypothetical protein
MYRKTLVVSLRTEREREKIVGVINEAVADEIIYAIEHTFGVKFLRKSLARLGIKEVLIN